MAKQQPALLPVVTSNQKPANQQLFHITKDKRTIITSSILIAPALLGLTLLGALSPLLSFARLFQLKEWRWDRLQEHLRQEGWLVPVFGTARLFLLLVFLPSLATPLWSWALEGLLSILALLTIAQFALRKQRKPVITSKALSVLGLSVILTFLLAVLVDHHLELPFLLPFLVVGQPLVVLLAWLLLKPLDSFLKQRVMSTAAELRRKQQLTVIGIAGSVGKTTTKELIKHLLQDLQPIATPAHVNTEMGVAQWLISKFHSPSSTHYSPTPVASRQSPFIIEMGAYREGEIALLCDIAQPTIGVLTTLGSDHLALFGSEEAIRRANAELIQALPKDGHAFIAVTDNASAEIANAAPCPTTTFKASDVSHLEEKADGLHLMINDHALHLPLHGQHNVTNLLLAVSVARHLNISWERIAQLLPSFQGTAHTFSVRNEQGVLLLDDTYNISLLSFKAALAWAKNRSERPRVLLTNGLLEVGEEEDHFHAELGELANGSIERAVFLNPRALKAFASTFKGEAQLIETASPIATGGALLCIGRMPLSAIQKLLPH